MSEFKIWLIDNKTSIDFEADISVDDMEKKMNKNINLIINKKIIIPIKNILFIEIE